MKILTIPELILPELAEVGFSVKYQNIVETDG
jgi:hypothetical protein